MDFLTLKRIIESDCDCHQSKFLYGPAGHVVTGDLNFVNNWHLKQLMQCGAKYRLPTIINWEEVLATSESLWHSFVGKHRKKFGLHIDVYVAACADYREIVQRRIDRERLSVNRPALTGIDVTCAMEGLRKLHSKFIVAPADKAANNFVICCKKYYLQCMCEEMGVEISQNGVLATGNETYEVCSITEEHLFKNHQQLGSFYGIKVQNEDLVVPKIFATPKLHKKPYKFRYISGARLSSVKKISQILQKVLRLFYNHFRNYCAAIHNNGGPNPFWSVVDSLSVLQKSKLIGTAKSVSTFDFSAMFTNIPHGVLEKNLFWLAELCFKNAGGDKSVNIGYKNAYFSEEPKSKIILDKHEVKQLIHDVLTESYVTFASFIFKQIKGVPMGGNASPTMADCCSAVLEYKFVMSKKVDFTRTDKFIAR